MEGVPFDWNDYLSSEGLSDIAPTGSGMQGVQTGQDGWQYSSSMTTEARTPMHECHDQQLASRHNSDNADESQGYNPAGLSPLDHEEDLISFAHKYDPIASQDQYRHHGSISNLEISEAGLDPAPPEQAPSSIAFPFGTGSDAFTQEVHDLGDLLADQICTCAVCLDRSSKILDACIEWRNKHRESRLWTFGCRVTGCQWTTKDVPWGIGNVVQVWDHESSSSHYGKPGDYRCREANCKYVTKRWGDLKRHYSSKHCIKPKTFKCPDLNCTYHQDGFARKDKLDSHYQKVHGGKSQPGKPNQAIRPKVGDSA